MQIEYTVNEDKGGIRWLYQFSGGASPEPAVSNEAFLGSYLRFGGYLRAVAAFDHLGAARRARTPLRRIAATAGMQQQLGAFAEDSIATLVAWCAWAKKRDILLADLYERIFVVQKAAGSPVEWVESLAAGSRRVRVDPGPFLVWLGTLAESDAVQTLGLIPGPADPAIARAEDEWGALPATVTRLISILNHPSLGLASATYNKIKHGPQVLVQDVREAAERRGGLEDSGLAGPARDPLKLRILLDGARLQESAQEREEDWAPAPFLAGELETLERLYFDGMLVSSMVMCRVAKWLFVCAFGRRWVPTGEDLIKEARHAAFARAKERLADEVPTESWQVALHAELSGQPPPVPAGTGSLWRAMDGDAAPRRNDRCWCGSGLKYKKCHLRQDESRRS